MDKPLLWFLFAPPPVYSVAVPQRDARDMTNHMRWAIVSALMRSDKTAADLDEEGRRDVERTLRRALMGRRVRLSDMGRFFRYLDLFPKFAIEPKGDQTVKVTPA